MIKLLRLVLALVGLVLIIGLALANRGLVDVSFWPLPYQVSLPLYAVFLIGLVIGVLLGGTAYALARHQQRVQFRQMRRKVAGLEYQDRLRREREEAEEAERARARAQTLRLAPAASR